MPRKTKASSTNHVTPAVAQADAQSDAGLRNAARKKRVAKGEQKRTPAGPVVERDHAAELRYRASRWAELHANPKKRADMDTQLVGLTEADQRHVILNGQRIRCGLTYKPQL